MKSQTLLKILVLGFSVVILVFGLIDPNGLRAALANNIWSVAVIQNFFDENSITQEQTPAPATHAHASLFLARLASHKGDLDQAIAIISPQATTSDPIALDVLAGLYYQQGSYEAAINTWDILGDSLSLEGAAHEQLAAGRPNLVALANQGLYKINPEKYTSSLALALDRLGNSDTGITLLGQSIQNYPNSPQLYKWYRYTGDIHSHQQEWLEAENAYQQALILNRNDAKTWRNFNVLCAGQKNDLDRSAACYQNLIELKPKDPDIYASAGQVFEAVNLSGQAQKAYENTLAIDPSNLDALEGLQRLSETP